MGKQIMLGQGTENTIIVEIAFYVIAASTLVSAIAVVQIRDLFRAALFLIVTLLGTAGMFILLRAEFLAGVQLMVYVGAISVLIIFAILMTRDLEEGSPSHSFRLPVAVISLIFMGLCIYAITQTEWSFIGKELGNSGEIFANSIPNLAELLLRDFVLAFEVVSVLLLAAVLGALALVRGK